MRRWTADEEATLEINLPDINWKNAHEFLPDRTLCAIGEKAYQMGLAGKRATRYNMFYSPVEVARILGVPIRTLRIWLFKGLFPDVEMAESLENPSRNPERQYITVRIPWTSVDDFIQTFPFLFNPQTFPDPIPGEVNHKRTLLSSDPCSWMTSKEAARFTGFSLRTIQRKAKLGELKHRRFGTLVYVHRNDARKLQRKATKR